MFIQLKIRIRIEELKNKEIKDFFPLKKTISNINISD